MRLGRTEVRQCVVVMVMMILPISRPVFGFQSLGVSLELCHAGKGREGLTIVEQAVHLSKAKLAGRTLSNLARNPRICSLN